MFRDGFFHADMHPGNIQVSIAPETFGRYIALDRDHRLDQQAHVDALGGEAQRKFAQGGEVSLAKKIIFGVSRAVAQIDFSFAQAVAKRLRSDVNEFDFIGEVDDRIGDGFLHGRSRDLSHRVGATFDVLDVQRSVNVNTGSKQLEHILIALRVPRGRRVGVSEFVDQHELRLAREKALQVKFS